MKNTCRSICARSNPAPPSRGPSEVWRSTKLWFIPYVVIALAAIFYLPRLVPTAPSASDSYIFGYNNRIGILLLLFFVALGVILTRGFNLNQPASV